MNEEDDEDDNSEPIQSENITQVTATLTVRIRKQKLL